MVCRVWQVPMETTQSSFFFLVAFCAFFSCVPKAEAACEVNTSIISFREDVPPGTVIMKIPRVSGEQWAFREDGPRGFIELRASQHQVVFYFAREPDLEYLNELTTLTRESLPFTLECSYDGWKHVFKQEIVLIDVNDNDPEFDPELPATVTVNENTSPGTSILHLRGYARDRDITGVVNSYNISRHVDAENDGYEYFGVTGNGNELMLRQPVDFDFLRLMDRSSYVLNLTAIDNGFPLPRQAHMTLRVNISDSDDQGPAFLYPDCPMLDGYCTTPLYEAALKKSFKGVLKIWPGHIKAVDMDSLNNSITYVIVSVAPEEYSSNFEMDPMSGEVRVIKEFDRDDIDAIHVTVKAEENSAARRFITSTMRVQVIGDLYTSYNDRFRNVPINDVTSLPQSQDDIQNTATLPISLFTATVIVFFLVIVVFPFVVLKFLKGKLLSEQTTVPSLSPLTRSGNLMRCSKRKESADTTTASIMSCGSTDTTCTTVFGNHHLDDDSNSDITSSSSSSSSPSSVHLDFVDSVAFGSSLVDQTRRVSSVAFDPEEIALRLGPGAPSRTEQNAADKLKRRLNELCSFHSCKDNKKSRVRFDIRNVSSFS